MASNATWTFRSASILNNSSRKDKRRSRRLDLSIARSVRSEMSLSIGTHLIPHPKKAESGGEDAFFVSSEYGVLAVADGVSGWAEKNINPALFARELMSRASNFIKDEDVNCDPQILLRKSHEATTSVGSATILIAMLEKNGTLKIANVGDCGMRIIRKGQIVFTTCPQEHYFDCPYQISSESIGQTYQDATKSVKYGAQKFKSVEQGPNFNQIKVCSIKLKEGDIIVTGSDGLFDNIFDDEILSEVSKFQNMKDAAKGIAELANNHSRDFYFDSPYSIEARKRGFDVKWYEKLLGKKLTGGKLDDITVVIGQIIQSSNEQ